MQPHALTMEHVLRCNALKCRRELNDQAVVTTCSHIFCLDCASRLNLSNPPPGQRPICPACEVHLNNPDDAVITNLNPTEDYKTSVLSGLSPNVIMECAGRALSFWAYQSTQELVYHDYLAKTLTEKYSKLNHELDRVVQEANSQIIDLRGKIANMNAEQQSLRRKNAELANAYNDKNRKYLQTQELYDKLKHKAMLGQVQDAAFEAVDESIHVGSAVANRRNEQIENQNMPPRPPPLFGAQQRDMHQPMRTRNEPVGMTPVGDRMTGNTRSHIFSSQDTQHDATVAATPSHRQRLTNLGPSMNSGVGINTNQPSRPQVPTPIHRRVSPAVRSPLGGLSGNAVSGNGFAGYGLSAGVKFSHPLSRAQNFGGDIQRQSSIPPRVAQRPSSGWNPGFLGNTGNPPQNLPNSDRFY